MNTSTAVLPPTATHTNGVHISGAPSPHTSFDSRHGEISIEHRLGLFSTTWKAAEAEISKVIVGMQAEVKFVLASLFAGGHTLVEGLPGSGKTLLCRTLAETLGVQFNRIQFTPDLMPSDILGATILQQDLDGRRTFEFKRGPIFTNLLLADEVNRTPPKTQSALLEAMGENQVSVDGESRPMARPFMVIATQNPLEHHGTYPLPEAQSDRFMVKLISAPASIEELLQISLRASQPKPPRANHLWSAEEGAARVSSGIELCRHVCVSKELHLQAAQLITLLNGKAVTIPATPNASECTIGPLAKLSKALEFGPGARGIISLIAISKVLAASEGRSYVEFGDLEAAAIPTLRHRISLGRSNEGIDGIITEALDLVR